MVLRKNQQQILRQISTNKKTITKLQIKTIVIMMIIEEIVVTTAAAVLLLMIILLPISLCITILIQKNKTI